MFKNDLSLRQAIEEDKREMYRWLFFGGHPMAFVLGVDDAVPAQDAFYEDGFCSYFFTGDSPLLGNCFIIEKNGKAVGTISYTAFHLQPKVAELDIWLSDAELTGQGIGLRAIELLKKELGKLGFLTLFMRPARENNIAQRPYQKAGFSVMASPDLSRYYLDGMQEKYGQGDFGEGGDTFMVMTLR